MHIRNIDLNLLVIFDSLMRERSVSKAADKLGMSQSGVSHALARLRALTGDPLFLREQRELSPTLRAENMLALVTPALAQMHLAVEGERVFRATEDSTHFHLLLPDLGEALILPTLLGQIAKQAPKMKIDVQPGFGREFSKDIYAARVHFAMDMQPPLTSGIAWQPWFQTDLVAIARPGRFDKKTELTLPEYAAEHHILYRPPGLPEPPLEVLLQNQGLHRSYSAEAATLSTLVFVASQTDFIATIPRRLAAVFTKGLAFDILDLPFMTQKIECYLWWPGSLETNPAHAWMRNILLSLE